MEFCKHEWDKGECLKCDKFAENLVFSYQNEMRDLGDRISKAELVMAKAYAWPNDGDPRTEYVKNSLREYRDKYPLSYTT